MHIWSSDSKILEYFQEIKLGSRKGFALSLPATLGLFTVSRDRAKPTYADRISLRGLFYSGFQRNSWWLPLSCSLEEEELCEQHLSLLCVLSLEVVCPACCKTKWLVCWWWQCKTMSLGGTCLVSILPKFSRWDLKAFCYSPGIMSNLTLGHLESKMLLPLLPFSLPR